MRSTISDCEVCGKRFKGLSYNANRFCSRECYHVVYSASERVEAIRALWETEHMSGAAIGKRLGITRNAVYGIARRNGFSKRETPRNFKVSQDA